MGNRASGYGDSPNFGGALSFRVQQERPDNHPEGPLWGVEFFLGEHRQFASTQFFRTEAEARAQGERELEARA